MNRTYLTRRALAAGAAAFAALTLAACGGSDESGGTDGEETSAAEDAAFNDADVAFAQMMIVHHEQAVEMSQLAAENAQDPEIIELAGQIEAAQAPEIETMTGWLEAWGEPVEMGDHGGHEMPGMVDEEHMTMMEELSGAEFDRHFVESMIMHHEGAIEMAEAEKADGENPDAVALCDTIIEAQSAEIEQMQTILDRL